MQRLILLSLVFGLVSCSEVERESSLDNAMALFTTNGVQMTPELKEEINKVVNSVFQFSHLQQEFENLRLKASSLKQQCSDFQKTSENSSSSKFDDIRNRLIALQIVAFQNDWPVEERFRFKAGELGC